VDDLEVLAAGVEHLQHLVVDDEQVEQGLQIDSVCLGIDRRSFIDRCDLDQAQVGPIGILAHELGVHGDEWLLRQAIDESFESVGLGNQWVNSHESRRGNSGASPG